MAMVVKLLDGDSVRSILHRGELSCIRKSARRISQVAVLSHCRRIASAKSTTSSSQFYSALLFGRPSLITKQILSGFYDYLGVSVLNADLPDTVEMTCMPVRASDAVLRAALKESVECGKDPTSGPSPWNSPGSRCDDFYSGRPDSRRFISKTSSGVMDITDPVYKVLPSYSKSKILVCALSAYAKARGADSQALYKISRSLCGKDAIPLAGCPKATTDPSTSVKQMSFATNITTHYYMLP